MDATRVDRWVWAVRVYKTRSDATKACSGGHVQLDGRTVKPAQKVGVGDRVHAQVGPRQRILEVARVIDKLLTARTADGVEVVDRGLEQVGGELVGGVGREDEAQPLAVGVEERIPDGMEAEEPDRLARGGAGHRRRLRP